MIQVCDQYILIVLVELNTLIYVRPLNEWQIPELGHFEVGNFIYIYERVQLDEYYQNILVTHLDHFQNLNPPWTVFQGVRDMASTDFNRIYELSCNLLTPFNDKYKILTLLFRRRSQPLRYRLDLNMHFIGAYLTQVSTLSKWRSIQQICESTSF